MGCSASRPNTSLFTKANANASEDNNDNEYHENNENPISFSPQQQQQASIARGRGRGRALSLPTPLVHHPPLRKGDTHHLVSLTSTTYGSLLLLDTTTDQEEDEEEVNNQDNNNNNDSSLSPDSVINTWELMDGLDDDPHFLDLGGKSSKSNAFTLKLAAVDMPVKKSCYDEEEGSYNKPTKPSLTKPLWKHLSEESLLSKLDPNVVSSYRRALSSRQLGGGGNECRGNEYRSMVSSVGSSPSCSSLSDSWFRVPSKSDGENRIVLYFTSLRGIRKTYEDCCCVRMIFRGFRVPVDERDISMDSMYRNELQSLLGRGKLVCLPQVFIRGKHVGGVEEIKQLNERGELARLLEGFPVRDPRIVCQGCGDARFVPCPNCNGSRKVFEEDQGRLRRCPDCNENGLIRCRACCSS